MIRVREVSVIGDDGEPLGIKPTEEAIRIAEDQDLDLVEVAPNSNPPVCRIMDYGKHKYKASKKAHEAKKNQKVAHIKEVKFRPNTDIHDYEVQMKNVVKFLENGDKVKCTLRFRGREMAHQQLGMDLLNRVRDDVEEIAKVEAFPRLEGRQMIMVLAPK